MKTQLNINALKAAAILAVNERPQLAGVLIEAGQAFVNYIGTDGRMLFAHREEELIDQNTLLGSFYIPEQVIRQIKIAKRESKIAWLELNPDGGLKLTLNSGVSYGFQPMDANFPDWREVTPKQFSKSHDQGTQSFSYDPNLVLKLWKAFELIGLAKPTITPNGIGPALVSYGYTPSTYGLIMPYRNETQRDDPPDWVHAAKQCEHAIKAA